jgi:hypothetical protein
LVCYTLPFREVLVNFVLTIRIRDTPMRKIHPGFLALAVLLGPATLILAHETITRSPAQEVFTSFDPPPIFAAGLHTMRGDPKDTMLTSV